MSDTTEQNRSEEQDYQLSHPAVPSPGDATDSSLPPSPELVPTPTETLTTEVSLGATNGTNELLETPQEHQVEVLSEVAVASAAESAPQGAGTSAPPSPESDVPPPLQGEPADSFATEQPTASVEAELPGAEQTEGRPAQSEGESLRTSSGSLVAANEVNADRATVIGQINIGSVSPIEAQSVKLTPIKDDDVERLSQLFVAPVGYAESQRAFVENLSARVAIIFGPVHVGKFTTAINLGLEVVRARGSTKTKFSLCRNVLEKDSFLDLMQQKEICDEQVYIIENAFDSGLDLRDVGGPQLRSVTELLAQKKSFLFLTTSRDESQLTVAEVDLVPAIVGDLGAVLIKHLDRYAGQNGLEALEDSLIPDTLYTLAVSKFEELVPLLKNPFQISQFCARLGRKEANDEAIIRFAQEIAAIDSKPTGQWWQSLKLNEQLYAMLAVLFTDVDRLALDEIYDEAVRQLREDGMRSLVDARRFGRDEMLERIYAHNDALMIKFNHIHFEQEVRRQVRNHHPLLWSLHPLLLKLIVEFRATEYWQLRQALGSALGRMGIYHLGKFEQVLLQLVEHDAGGVVATAGYALDEVCRVGVEYYSFVGGLIDSWATSENYDYTWAVGASVSRVYETVAQAARNGVPGSKRTEQAHELRKRLLTALRKLAGSYDQFNEATRLAALVPLLPTEEQSQAIDSKMKVQMVSAQVAERFQNRLDQMVAEVANSILHSVRQIAQTNMADIVEELIQWLAPDSKETQQSLAVLAANQLFGIGGDRSIHPYDSRHLPLLELIGPLLDRFAHWYAEGNRNSQLVNQTLSEGVKMIRTWLAGLDWAGREEERVLWQNRAYTVLLRAATHADAVCGALLRELALEHLVGDLAQPPDVSRLIGQALIARVSFMRGFPTLMPGYNSIVILVDGSSKGLAGNVGSHLGWVLFTRLDPQIDVYLYQMGNMARLAQPGEPLSAYAPAARPLPVDATAESVKLGPGTARAGHPLARLVVPQLEAVDAERTLCALLLAWDIPEDIADLQEGPWSGRLLLASEGGKSGPELMPQEVWSRLSMRLIRLDHLANDENCITTISKEVRARVAQLLLETKPEALWAALEPHLPVGADNRDGLAALLTEWAEHLADIDDTNYRGGRLRLLACTVLWLAASDLSTCIDLLEAWLKSESAAAQYCGQACARMLFAVYTEKSAPPLDPFAQILRLAPYLGELGWEDALVVFEAVKVWARDEEWYNRLMTAENGESELMLLVSRLAEKASVRAQLIDYLTRREWMRPRERRHGKAHDSVLRLGEQIALRAELGALREASAISVDTQYGLILVDAGVAVGQSLRTLMAATCSTLLSLLAEQPIGDDLTLLALRLGRAVPFTSASEKPAPSMILPDGIGCLPRLLGPLIENFSSGQVEFILLITAGSLHDEDDWREHEISSRIHVAAFHPAARHHPFIPVALRSNLNDTHGVAKDIFADLKRKIGVASWDVSSALSA